MFYLTGELQVKIRSPADAEACLTRIVHGLRERFSDVQIQHEMITASSRGLDLVFRGGRTHPMLAFESATFQGIREGENWSLKYRLGRKWQIFIMIYIGLATGLLAIIDRGFINGLAVGLLFAFFVASLNVIITTFRARRWIASLCGR